MPYDAVFDANTVAPRQGGGAHPVGNKFPFSITNTEVKATKDQKGGLFEVELTSSVGSITNRYNLWNENDTARRIANEQLSALCHAVGIFRVDFKNDGAALRGASGMMDIGFQKGHEPSAEKPEGGFVELKKVYDRNGNEPGKANAAPAQQSQPQVSTGFVAQAQPVQQAAHNTANALPANNIGGWQPHQQNEQQVQSAQNGPAWGAATGAKPPWG